MSQLKRILIPAAMVLLATLFLASTATAAEKLVPKVDNVLYFLDYSGSMAMHSKKCGDKKIVMAKEIMSQINEATPELGYNAGLYTFAPYGEVSGIAPYSKSAIAGGIDSIETDYTIFNRRTPMGPGLIDLDSVLSKLSGSTAVIMVTDGKHNLGVDPVAEAKALSSKYDICFHVVSLADDAKGQKIIDGIRAVNDCSCKLGGTDCDKTGFAEFTKCALYDIVIEQEVIIEEEVDVIRLRGVHFNFDKSNIRPVDVPVLEEAVSTLKEFPNLDVVIEGYTDSIGTEQYNMGLSQRRANSVKDWLVENGISESRLSTMGYGESDPVATNKTPEGRALNRRVQFRVK